MVKMAIVLTTAMLERRGTDDVSGEGSRVLVIDVNESMSDPDRPPNTLTTLCLVG